MKRCALLLCFLLVLLLSACGGSAPSTSTSPIRTTELRSGTQQCNVDVQISGDISPENGAWLTFSVFNHSGGEVYLSINRDSENTVRVAPGETGSITKQLNSSVKSYLCKAAPSAAGGDVKVTYTLTQSTVSPS